MNNTISSTSTDAPDVTASLVRGALELGEPLLYMHHLAECDWCNAENGEEPASLLQEKVEKVAVCASALRSMAASELKRSDTSPQRNRLIEKNRLNRIAENAALVEKFVCQAQDEFVTKFRSRQYCPQLQLNSEPECYFEEKCNVLRKSPMAGGTWQQLRDAVDMLIAELPQKAQVAFRLAIRLTREYCPTLTYPDEVARDLQALGGCVLQRAGSQVEGFSQVEDFNAAETAYDLLERIPDLIDQALPVIFPDHLEILTPPGSGLEFIRAVADASPGEPISSCSEPEETVSFELSWQERIRHAENKLERIWGIIAEPEPPTEIGTIRGDTPPPTGEPLEESGLTWNFEPGYASYAGVRIVVSGKKAQLLETFVKARRGRTLQELQDEVWDGIHVEPSTVRTHISHLRKFLQQEFGTADDPLPNVDHGERTAWRLDEACLSADRR